MIKKLSLELDKLTNPILSPYKLSPTQYRIIKYLYNNENVRQIDIQNAYSLTNPTVTGILKNMEHNGWIIRNSNPNDKRSKIISLTKKSIDIKDELYNIGNKLENLFTKNLTSIEKTRLLKLLNKMLERRN